MAICNWKRKLGKSSDRITHRIKWKKMFCKHPVAFDYIHYPQRKDDRNWNRRKLTWTVGKLVVFFVFAAGGLLAAVVGEVEEFPDRVDMVSWELLEAN